VPQIEHLWQADRQVGGADKVWRQLVRESTTVARCTVERLRHQQGLHGVVRGKVVCTTTGNSPVKLPRWRLDLNHTASPRNPGRFTLSRRFNWKQFDVDPWKLLHGD
jgi:putative transposase